MSTTWDRPVRRVDNRLMSLIALGLLFFVGSVFLAVSADRVVVIPAPEGSLVAQRSLLFTDGYDGQVRIIDADAGVDLRTLNAGEGSFIRGVVRSFSRARQQSAVVGNLPLLLQQYSDGRLILSDPATRESIELVSFGPTNAGAFQRLLSLPAHKDLSRP